MSDQPQLQIRYCRSCGYLTRALSLATVIETQMQLNVELVPVSGGRYELWDGDTLVQGRTWFTVPSEEVLLAALRDHLAPGHPSSPA